ncbi:MAG: geranylgeranyl reductase [Chloroflexi bacterium]|nr:geranylgeranyl reductase [Chloroflexota bacterium]
MQPEARQLAATKRYDAIVVGAGPAGAVAALRLARGGAHVALLDREDFPRDKPCGDLLGRAAVRECLDLGVDPVHHGAFRVRGVYLRAPGGSEVRGIAYRGRLAPFEACVLPRRVFDSTLVTMAVDAGAQFCKAHVTGLLRDSSGTVQGVQTRDAPFVAPLVIGADGWGSAVARSLLGVDGARPAQTGLAIRCYVDGVEGLNGRMHFFHDADLLPGCCWIFPLGKSRANVGLGTLSSDSTSPAPRLADRLDRLIHDPVSPAAPLLHCVQQVENPVTWPLALGWRSARLAFDGAMIAGDAGSLISPLSGSGIAAAMRSGRLAGDVGLRSLACGNFSRSMLVEYERSVRGSFRWRYSLERSAQDLIHSPRRLDNLARWGMRVPYSQRVAASLLFNLG